MIIEINQLDPVRHQPGQYEKLSATATAVELTKCMT